MDKEFRPSIHHPYYFIRKGLVSKIQQYSHLFNGRFLDFGCGSKPYKSLFNVNEYIGVDFVNEGHPHDNEEIDVYYDGKTIPLPDNHFDTALSSEVFEHIFNLEEILGELNRVLKPGGTLLITCPFVWKEHEVPNDYARYTVFALTHLFEKNGFSVEKIDKSGDFVKVITQLYVLYFFDHLYPKVKSIFVLRTVFKIVFFAIPHIMGSFLSKILPVSKTIYFNNIIIAKKNDEL